MKKIIFIVIVMTLMTTAVIAKVDKATTISMKTAIHKIEPKEKPKKEKPKEKPKKKKKWVSLGKVRTTQYCPMCNDPVGSYQSASGKTLENGMVACSWLKNGTVLKIEGKRYVVQDTCGTEAIDIFIDTDECRCSENEYKEVKMQR